jgi:hypothetical protein
VFQVGDEEDSPALSAAAGADGFYKLLVDALDASLNGTDYPIGSNLFYRNWKVRPRNFHFSSFELFQSLNVRNMFQIID